MDSQALMLTSGVYYLLHLTNPPPNLYPTLFSRLQCPLSDLIWQDSWFQKYRNRSFAEKNLAMYCSVYQKIKKDLQFLERSNHLSLGKKCGRECGIHTPRSCLNEDYNDALLLIGAKNTFNQLNRILAIYNISKQCPSPKNAENNSYQAPYKLFVERERQFRLKKGHLRATPLLWQ